MIEDDADGGASDFLFAANLADDLRFHLYGVGVGLVRLHGVRAATGILPARAGVSDSANPGVRRKSKLRPPLVPSSALGLMAGVLTTWRT